MDCNKKYLDIKINGLDVFNPDTSYQYKNNKYRERSDYHQFNTNQDPNEEHFNEIVNLPNFRNDFKYHPSGEFKPTIFQETGIGEDHDHSYFASDGEFVKLKTDKEMFIGYLEEYHTSEMYPIYKMYHQGSEYKYKVKIDDEYIYFYRKGELFNNYEVRLYGKMYFYKRTNITKL